MGEVKWSLEPTAHENTLCSSQHGSPDRCEPHVNHVIWKPPQIAKGPPRVCAMCLLYTYVHSMCKLKYNGVGEGSTVNSIF